jgi:hypothetical protein
MADPKRKNSPDGLTSKRSIRGHQDFFQRICPIIVASKKITFFVAPVAAIFAKSPEMRFGPVAGPTSGRAAPFKKFSKK